MTFSLIISVRMSQSKGCGIETEKYVLNKQIKNNKLFDVY